MIRLSTKGRYATRIMVTLALRGGAQPARKQEIAEAENISADYVEQILMRLKAAGLVLSHRGARGGFSLAVKPDKLTVYTVLVATEGPLDLVPCAETDCDQLTTCVTREVWEAASAALEKVFKSTTIGELARNALRHRSAHAPSYVI